MKKVLRNFALVLLCIITISMFTFFSININNFNKKFEVTNTESEITFEKNDLKLSQQTTYDDEVTRDSLFNVGSGSNWPSYVYAPFVDITAWTTKSGYVNNGVLDLGKIYDDTGVLYYNLGFVNCNFSSTNTITKDGKQMIDWCFGGYSILSEHNSDDWQYEGIKESIKNIRNVGGDVALSFGGGNELNFFQQTQDITILENTYLDVINGFGLTKIDLDIEGSAQNKAINIANAKALKLVQEKTQIQITLTLPVLPTGLTKIGLDILDAYLEEGVVINMVNIMTMCYGEEHLLSNESYGQSTLRAAESTKNQIKERYLTKLGQTLTDTQAYKLLATTLSIGKESSSYPIFTPEWTSLMYDFAVENKLGMLSFWSLNRDSMTVRNGGISKQYTFTDIYKNYISALAEISFDSNGGSSIDSIGAVTDTTILPTVPATCDDIAMDKYILNNDSQGENNIDSINNQIELASISDIPIKEGYKFLGWYIDENLTEKFDENTPITGDMVLYAKWAPNDPNIDVQESTITSGAILGIVFGAVGLIIIISAIIFFNKKRNR